MTPDQVYADFRRAELLLAAQQPQEAARVLEAALRTLVERRPDDAWAHVALARTLERRGREDDAAVHRRLAAALGVADDAA